MKVIIAEKPSVAREIARVVRATNRKEGYIEGSNYTVTWALGHLITAAMPEAYGFKGFHKENLPILPPVFTLIPRQVKSGKGYKADPSVVAQLKVIEKLFKAAESIIVATDAGREGELIFRFIYEYLGIAKPFERLWISSLTDKAIREGLAHLKSGAEYDNLYYAARARSEADWLVGINATQAVSIAAGYGTYSLGRVQTPTLCMVCSRFWENKKFTPQPFWQLSLSVKDGDENFRFSNPERCFNKEEATALYEKIKAASHITIETIVRKEAKQEPPLLYDLTTLQKEANSRHRYSAEQTLTLAQKLYERGYITYPRTGSRYISEDVFEEIPALIAFLHDHPVWGIHTRNLFVLNARSVNGKKVTDHHALLITGKKPIDVFGEEAVIYNMIAGRMLEAFSPRCEKDVTTVTALCEGVKFTLKGEIIRQEGWRSILKNEKGKDKEQLEAEERESRENGEGVLIPEWNEGMQLAISACSLAQGTTKPKPLHTESSLLSAMETAGKELEDEELRVCLKDCGIGTPATRAAIIETLFTREYMVRKEKSLVPTEKGLVLYSIVKEMKIGNAEMTGQWEADLAKIERGEMKEKDFRKDIESYATQITDELLSSKILFPQRRSDIHCPKCGKGTMVFHSKCAKCSDADCGWTLFRTVAGKSLTDEQLTQLAVNGETGIIKGFTSKAGKRFEASLSLDGDFKTVFVFPERKKTGKSRR
ncbi:topoisomerase C-terminal repeat-containing protein [Hoylesella buccalis]|uniref:DNA topoisomerase n=4 Tax=Prevotellaceae TaxID=171552 RepID=A0A098YSP0_9BACT|nr:MULTISPECIES: type IA DNA topoisomerase [Prevotellaceae]ERT57598.1 DNA topoisomerase [Prevotella sp. BV3P1]KGF34248.1 DNA topoisomerase I [Hoylesella buccalis DNF00853]KGF41118.1 DNA topoisomerase I [Hoylesella buccalis DNF00985]KGF48994.1 DNA topoisomerase I [Prevotella disiens DNF00882]KGI21643.1 DNA topoisomerase I [Hoylesella timonensis S9-PR14]